MSYYEALFEYYLFRLEHLKNRNDYANYAKFSNQNRYFFEKLKYNVKSSIDRKYSSKKISFKVLSENLNMKNRFEAAAIQTWVLLRVIKKDKSS